MKARAAFCAIAAFVFSIISASPTRGADYLYVTGRDFIKTCGDVSRVNPSQSSAQGTYCVTIVRAMLEGSLWGIQYAESALKKKVPVPFCPPPPTDCEQLFRVVMRWLDEQMIVGNNAWLRKAARETTPAEVIAAAIAKPAPETPDGKAFGPPGGFAAPQVN